MRTKRTLLAAACAAILVIAMAPAAMASDEGSATSGVGFVQECHAVQLAFNADVGPTGDARGWVNARSGAEKLRFKGKVDCFNRVGNTAYLSGIITKGGETSRNQTFLIGVTDNGEPDSAGTPDKVGVEVYGEKATKDCSSMGINFVPVLSGDLEVRGD